jgi:hypothetical protein
MGSPADPVLPTPQYGGHYPEGCESSRAHRISSALIDSFRLSLRLRVRPLFRQRQRRSGSPASAGLWSRTCPEWIQLGCRSVRHARRLCCIERDGGVRDGTPGDEEQAKLVWREIFIMVDGQEKHVDASRKVVKIVNRDMEITCKVGSRSLLIEELMGRILADLHGNRQSLFRRS